MKYTLREIASLIQAKVEGDPSIEIDDLSGIEDAKPGSLTFLANPRYTSFLYTTQASAVLIPPDFEPTAQVNATLLRVQDPYSAFSQLLKFAQDQILMNKMGKDAQAFIDDSATIGKDVYIGAFAYIGKKVRIEAGAKIYPFSYVGDGSIIGKKSILYPHVTVYHDCEIGEDCIIHSGARIGSDGFGFAPQEDGSFLKIPQMGNVVLEDQVEIGANTCIDRATMGSTRIKRGVKLDNLVQIAHNVEVGQNTVMAAQAGVAGSTQLAENCMIGGQAGIVGHLSLAKGTKIDAQSGVNRSIKEVDKAFRGSPIQPYRNQLKSEIMFRRLAEMENRISELESKLNA